MFLDALFQAKREPAECVIRIGGEEISDLYPFLTELTVETSRSRAGQATLRFEARRFEDGSWPIQDDARIATWEPIEIDAVFGETVEEVMRGHIRQISPAIRPAQVPLRLPSNARTNPCNWTGTTGGKPGAPRRP